MTSFERSLTEARALHVAYLAAMRVAHQEAAHLLIVAKIERAAVEVAVEVMAGSLASADEAQHLAELDVIAVAGLTIGQEFQAGQQTAP